MRRTIVMVALALVALMLVGPVGMANGNGGDRALTVAAGADTYYLFFHGGEFPTGHGVIVYKETNNAGKPACSVPEGVPVFHDVVKSTAKSGLQISSFGFTCTGALDTKVA